MNSENGCTMRGVPIKGYLATEVLEKEEFKLDELGCLRDLEPVIPLAKVWWW